MTGVCSRRTGLGAAIGALLAHHIILEQRLVLRVRSGDVSNHALALFVHALGVALLKHLSCLPCGGGWSVGNGWCYSGRWVWCAAVSGERWAVHVVCGRAVSRTRVGGRAS